MGKRAKGKGGGSPHRQRGRGAPSRSRKELQSAAAEGGQLAWAEEAGGERKERERGRARAYSGEQAGGERKERERGGARMYEDDQLRSEHQMKKIIWDEDRTTLFNHICFQEITQGNMEVGKLSEEACETIRERLLKEGIQCSKSQVQNKWDGVKRLHSFWHQQVLGAKVKVKDEKFWKNILKSRVSMLEYANLRYGPPKDIEYLDIIFGNKSAQKSAERSSDENSLHNEIKDLKKDLEEDLKELKEDQDSFVNFLQNELKELKQDRDSLQNIVKELKKDEDCLHTDLKELKEGRDALKNELKKVKEEFKRSEDEIKHFKELLDIKDSQIQDGERLRKTLYNNIVELKGNMRVFVRVRPFLKGSEEAHHISYPKSVELIGRGIDITKEGRVNQFKYDKVFGPESKQEDVFGEVSELVESSLNGYKVCIFTYGQTGSGKTYTMIGAPSSDKQGIIPRALKKIFDSIGSQKSWIYTVNVSVGEIYLKDLYDLLAPNHCKIQTTANLTETVVTDTALAMVLLEEALRKRCVRSTNMNESSSRSHFVFELKISGSNEEMRQSVQGYLNFIDLAGSQRNKKSGSEGISRAEANAINVSLLNLNTVFTKIANKEEHVPFRNSKLTSVLQPYLIGGPKTLMVVNITPDVASIDETIFSLQYAQRAKDCMIGKPIQEGGHSCTLSPNKVLPPARVKEPTATTSRQGGYSFFSPNKAVTPTWLKVPFSAATHKQRASSTSLLSPKKHIPPTHMKQKKPLVEGTRQQGANCTTSLFSANKFVPRAQVV